MLDIVAHKTILLQILKDIYGDLSIAPVLGFKGGTACFLFYDLPRFSVDLDFDVLEPSKEDIVFEKVRNLLGSYGRLQDAHKKRHTLFFVLSYEKGERTIKVEISRRDFGSAYEIKNYLGISMLVMRKEDIFAHKLVALLERKQTANRDLYDVWFFLKSRWEINKRIVEQRTQMAFKAYLKKCVALVEKIDANRILAGLGDPLDNDQKRLAKRQLKEDLLFLLRLKLSEEE